MGVLFGRKKRAAGDPPIPEVSEFPLKAYVYRLQPEKIGRIQVAGRVPGDFDGWNSAQDLEDMVARVCGGGTYRCKVVKSGDTKTHIGYHNFVIPGVPLIEGNPVDEVKQEREKAEAKKIEKIEEEIEVEEAQSRLDETKAKRRQKQKQLGLIEDDSDDDDSTPTPTFGIGGMEDPRISQLENVLKSMERRLEEKDREMERKQYESKIAQIEDRVHRDIEAIKLAASAKQGDGGVAVMMNAQMEAIKALMQASQQQTQAMMSSNSEMIKLIMTRDPSAGINDRVDRLVEKLLETKGQTGKEVMDAMKESFNTGIMMARGGEQQPTTMADVAREFGGKVADIVSEFMRQKGQMTRETLAQEIQKATARVVGDVKRSLLPQVARPRVLPPGGVSAGEAMPQAPEPHEPELRREELRNRVDKVMSSFLEDMDHGTESWKTVAKAQIPPSELQRIGEFTFDRIATYCMQHGTPAVVRRVMDKLVEMEVITEEQAAAIVQGYAYTAPPAAPHPQPSGLPQGSSDDVLADDTEEDESLMGGEEPVPQGDAVPVPDDEGGSGQEEQPAKSRRRGRAKASS